MLNTGNTKPFLSIDNQLNILCGRGLDIADRAKAAQILSRINYYRFSAYSLTLSQNDKFYPGASFDNIYQLYCFDDDFRKIILKYTAYVEIAFRTYIAYTHAKNHQPQGYLNSANFRKPLFYAQFLTILNKQIGKSSDVFITHHKDDLNNVYPFWVSIEIFTFGSLSKLYKNMLASDQKEIANNYNRTTSKYIENWLQCCVVARNIAAHGGRFYNRDLRECSVLLPRKLKKSIKNTKPFSYIFALYKLVPTPQQKEDLLNELKALFAKYPFALLKHMGFPSDWISILEDENKPIQKPQVARNKSVVSTTSKK